MAASATQHIDLDAPAPGPTDGQAAPPAVAPPAFVDGQGRGSAASSWRQYVLSRANELRVFAGYAEARARTLAGTGEPGTPDLAAVEVLASATRSHLDEATAAAQAGERGRLRAAVTGASVERAMSNLNAAQVHLARYAPLDELAGWLPDIVADVRSHLQPDDPRRLAVDAVADRRQGALPLVEGDRRVLAWAMHGVATTSEQQHIRVRSFRNIVLFTAGVLLVIALSLAALGVARPEVLPLCFEPGTEVVCATAERTLAPGDDAQAAQTALASSWDVVLILAVGLVAAALAGAFSLHQIKGTSTPFSVPLALGLLKLPCGALTALLGILLMRGEFVPGLSALDSSGQIIAWAIVFGYAQQVFTHLVDRQAQTVLNAVGTPGPARLPAPA